MAATVDAGYIAASYSLPEPSIRALLDNPTTDLVTNLLLQVEGKAREYEAAQAEKLRSDVELETAVRNGNTRAKQLKDSVDKGLKQIGELRRKLSTEETARAAVEAELQNLKSSSSSSGSDLQALQSRISSLESSNRDALSLLESKSTAYDKLAEEMSAQQQKLVVMRREAAELEAKVQSAENAALAMKFREQRLQEEVELLKKRDEWHEEELKRRSAEHTKYRKEKTLQISELQRSVEEVTQINETLRSTETQLRNRLDDVIRKLEDAYAQLRNKDEDAARRENSSRSERDNALRLADLQKKSAETARARQLELERGLDQIKEDAATEIGNLQADIQAEQKDKDAAERRVDELESRVAILQNELSVAHELAPSTPRRTLNGASLHVTPGKIGSPLTPNTSRLKAGMTMTQMVSEYSKLKAELDSERRTAQELRSEMDNMISDLENRQPEIEELRMDHARLQSEVEESGTLLERANHDRDAARKAARKWEGTAHGFAKETELLKQQLRDLSSQIKLLLVEMQARDQGLENLTLAQQAQFEQLARSELDESELAGMSDTGRFISARLVAFRTVAEMQEQNAKLLAITRKLGEEMEGEEAKAKKHQQEKDHEELEDLRAKVIEYKDTIQSLTTRSDSYIRERDMFRRMLAHRGQLPQGADPTTMFGQSLGDNFMPGTPSRAQSTEPSADARALQDHIKLIKELQQHFDAYKEESATNHSALKQQNDALSRDKHELQGENARWSGQVALAQERYSLLQANYEMLKNENVELQKRSQVLSENAAKQDLRTQQVAEELMEAKGLADSMRNETANLKAERELWKRIETRLTEDNQSLMEERSRLNKMVSNLQSLSNERELADSEMRRRLQTRIENLESELSAAKRKLDEEVEAAKKASLRREYETEQNRTRIDDLLKSSSNYKEELVVVKTQRDQLQARVDELKIELKNAQDKATALQPRLTARPTSGAPPTENDENALTREQELGVEVADLKRDSELKEAELQQCKEETEHYRLIAQSAEEELQQMIETSDQYRQMTDQAIAEKDARIAELVKRMEEISSELASTNTELSDIRSRQDESTAHFNEQRVVFESELARLRDESDRLAETARLHQEDLKAQAEIAQQAQQNYDHELIKHAEAASSLQKLRAEYNALKTEIAGFRAEAEAAKLSLSQNEESSAETRQKYEQEITELKNSREELKTQNRRLHQQLEEVSSQIAGLKQSRATYIGEDGEGPLDVTSDNLQEIIRYLRTEKEIVDMQYELSIQESKRLKQQLEHAHTQLDQTREKLDQERRNQADKEQNATSHARLMQTINELNLFRESNSSLRNEARAAQEQLARKIKEVEDLTVQLEPIQLKVRESEYELESRTGEIKLLQQDRDRWQKRTQDIMQKYDRVDPAELEALKTRISDLEQEIENKVTLQAEVDAFPDKIREATDELNKNWEERRNKLVEQSKTKVREVTTSLREKTSQLDIATAEQTRLSTELATIKEELESTKAARDEALQKAPQKPAAQPASEIEEGQVNEGPIHVIKDNDRAILDARAVAAEERASAEASRVATLQQEVQNYQVRIEGLMTQISNLEQSLEAANSQLAAAQTKPNTTQNTTQAGVSAEEIERLQNELSIAQREVEALEANQQAAAVNETNHDAGATHLPTTTEVEQRIAELRQKFEAEYNKKGQQQEELFNLRTTKMKEQLNKKLQEFKANAQEKHNAEIEKIKAESKSGEASATPSTNATAGGKAENWQPTEEEIRQLLKSNDNVRKVMRGNIEQGIAAKIPTIKAEEEKVWQARLEEASKVAQVEKEKAVNAAKEMEAKRNQVKLNMSQGKANTLNAQIDVVKQAAAETPQRPVGEVWEIAKSAKAGPVTAQRQSLMHGGVLQMASTTGPTGQAMQATAQIANPQLNQTSPNIDAAAPAASQQPVLPGAFGAPSGLPQAARRTSNVNPSIPPSVVPVGSNLFNAQQSQAGSANHPLPAGRGQHTGTGPAALRNLVSPGSGIPRPGAPSGPANNQQGGRGSQLPRGGGVRGARGGQVQSRGGRGGNMQTAGAGRGRGGGPASPMNANASQFIPGAAGAKRPHDGSGQDGEGKRIKPDGEQ